MGQIVSNVVALFLTVGLCLSLLFVEKKHAALVCKAIDIAIKDHPGQSFITQKEIINLIEGRDHNVLLNKPLKSIDTYAIQHQLTNHPLIQSVLVYKTWNGTLKICLSTKRFIARIISLTAPSSAQIYLDEQGTLIALKDLPPLRLLVVAGDNIATQGSKLHDKGLRALLDYIHKDSFWSRQITSLEVAANGHIILGTQIGGHEIAFGKAKNIEEKFEKLQLFYSQVIPYKGWKAYHRVNVAFKDQLICE